MEGRKIGLALCAAAALVGLTGTFALTSGIVPNTKQAHIRRAQGLIRAQMKDPSSTRFSDIVAGADGWVCGNFNSKNSYGAYAGEVGFAADPTRVYLSTGYSHADFLRDMRSAFDARDLQAAIEAQARYSAMCDYRIASSSCPDAPRESRAIIAKGCAASEQFAQDTIDQIAAIASHR